MKGFFEKASLHTIEDLQTFGNNFVPAPFWVRVIRVLIPLSTREEANEILIQTLGEEEIEKVVGGRTWWGQTANEEGGVNGEWISMKRDWQGLEGEEGDEEFEKVKEERVKRMKEEKERRDKRRWKVGREKEKRAERAEAEGGVGATEAVTDDEGGEDGEEGDETYTEEMDEMRCLLYIHGGAYFFGSPNTHRYSIWRYARKIGGRAFGEFLFSRRLEILAKLTVCLICRSCSIPSRTVRFRSTRHSLSPSQGQLTIPHTSQTISLPLCPSVPFPSPSLPLPLTHFSLTRTQSPTP